MEDNQQVVQQLFQEGAELLQQGDAAAALKRFQEALARNAAVALLHLYAGTALHELGRYEEAIAAYRSALEIAPQAGEVHNNRGNSLMALGRFTEAVASFSRAAELLPASPVPLTARATALQALGMVREAETDCRRALTIDPAFAEAHWNLSLALLLTGKYHAGWQEYEWRWQRPTFTSPRRHDDIPLWDGTPLDGRTILLHAEQGFGDALQFARYIPLVASRGGRVVVECHPPLATLLESVAGVTAVLPFGVPVPPAHCQAPLLSLPRIFDTTLESIPQQLPYLCAPAGYGEKWAVLLPRRDDTLRIGLVWGGKSYPDPLRSARLADFAPLADMTGVRFYSLQIGEAALQATSPPEGMQLIDVTGQIGDFADTAALIDELDLVISIDTAVAHLAAAVGKPVFLLLPLAADWRWLRERSDSPWYPGMELFRQRRSGEWGEVVQRVRSAVIRWSGGQKKSFRNVPKD